MGIYTVDRSRKKYWRKILEKQYQDSTWILHLDCGHRKAFANNKSAGFQRVDVMKNAACNECEEKESGALTKKSRKRNDYRSAKWLTKFD